MSGDVTNILIGIQARSTSTRLPNKGVEVIGDKRMVEHVVEACKSSAYYLNRAMMKRHPDQYEKRKTYNVNFALLVPAGDHLAETCRRFCPVIEGPEDDVLSRYMVAVERFDSDFVVRVTGDCPLMAPHVISKHVNVALINGYDYIANCWEDFRLSLDGVDCEVISRRLMDWMHENAKAGPDREHVTLMARKAPPPWARRSASMGYFDLSWVKFSVDTPEDLDRVRGEYAKVNEKLKMAEDTVGRQFVHRF